MTPARTIEEALREAAASLRDAGIERPRVDAELLLTHLLGVRRVDLLMRARDPLPPENEAAFADWVRRRAARCPLPYLIGEREFMGLRFLVDEHVLIPRPETEVLVEAALGCVGVWGCGSVGVWECGSVEERPAVGSGSPVSGPSPTPPHSHTPILLVDVGTGSGAIAVSLAHFAPEARVLATDVSPEACAVARENARRLGVAERVEVLEGDLLEPVVRRLGEMGADARADVVCANLPYVPAESLPGLQPEVRDWEPRPALDGGPGGLDLVERLLAQVPVVLRPGGSLLLEIGPEAGQPERLTALLDVSGLYCDVRVLPDLAGLPRVVVGRAKSGKRRVAGLARDTQGAAAQRNERPLRFPLIAFPEGVAMPTRLKIGVIGAGAIAEVNHLPGYDRVPDANVIAIADPNLDRAEAMAKKHGIPLVFQDYHELLRRDEIAAVSVCTPNAAHFEHVLAALRAGKHVLCEVPMALRLSDCTKMMRQARDVGCVLMPALTYRFYPCHQRARQMIAEGAIGRPILFRARFANDGPYVSWSASSDWYYDPAQAGGGALADRGIHALDLFRFHMGEADAVTADTACLLKEIRMEDHAALVLRGDGIRAHIEASWSAREVVSWTQIHGTGGILAIDCKTPLHLFVPGTGWQAVTEPHGSGADAQMAHFVECCLTGRPPLVTAQDGMRALGMLLGAYESAKSGRRVSL